MIHELTTELKTFTQVQAVLTVGSTVSNQEDKYSDADLIIICSQIPNESEREILCKKFGNINVFNINTGLEFGTVDEFTNSNGLYISCMYYTEDDFDKKVNRILNGEYHKTGRYYPLAFLACLQQCTIIWDKSGKTMKTIRQIETYPSNLSKYIINRETYNLFPYFIKNIEKGIARKDLYFAYRMIDESIESILNIIFAKSKTFYKGPKRLSEQISTLDLSNKQEILSLINDLFTNGTSISEIIEKKDKLNELFTLVDSQ